MPSASSSDLVTIRLTYGPSRKPLLLALTVSFIGTTFDARRFQVRDRR